MAVVFPSETIARRWNGALQARLHRAPLEQFLANRGIALAPAGAAQDTDNLVRATLYMVEAGLRRYCLESPELLSEPQYAAVGYAACLVSGALAQLITQPAAWRTVALVSTTRLLSPWIGLTSAAMESASSVRRFQAERRVALSDMDADITQRAAEAVREATAGSQLTILIARSLVAKQMRDDGCAAGPAEQRIHRFS